MNGPGRRFHIRSKEVCAYTIREHPRGRSAIHAAISPRAHSGYELDRGTLFGSLARPSARIRSPPQKSDRKDNGVSPSINTEPGSRVINWTMRSGNLEENLVITQSQRTAVASYPKLRPEISRLEALLIGQHPLM
jgi:hypothetical protein